MIKLSTLIFLLAASLGASATTGEVRSAFNLIRPEDKSEMDRLGTPSADDIH